MVTLTQGSGYCIMIHRDIDKVSPGTVLASDILGTSGHILVNAGTVLSPRQLRILKAHGITQITIQTPHPTLPSDRPVIPPSTAPHHVLEMFRHSNAGHPLIKELIRLYELRTGRPLRRLCQHGD